MKFNPVIPTSRKMVMRRAASVAKALDRNGVNEREIGRTMEVEAEWRSLGDNQ